MRKILTDKITSGIDLQDDQQRFIRGRSCNDSISIISKMIEKSLEYSKASYICFVELQKPFDRIRLIDVLAILELKHIPSYTRKVVKKPYTDTKIMIRSNGEISHPIKSGREIKQRDSLRLLLCYIIFDKIILSHRNLMGYRMGRSMLNILRYAYDAILIAENEDNLQRFVANF